MQTIKTAVVVVLLLVVLYGAYIAINGSDTELPPELQNMLANESDMDIDVSMPSFDSAGAGPSSGLNPNSPFGSTQGLKPGSGLSSNPNPIFGSPSGSNSSAPKTLTPPKLTNIPSFPSMNDSPPPIPNSLSNNDLNKPEKLNQVPVASEDSSFSLNLDGPNKAVEPKGFAPLPLSPPSNVASNQKPLGDTSIMSIPGMVASQATPTADRNSSQPTSGLKVPDVNKPNEADTVASVKKANITGRSFENAKRAAIEQVDRGEFKEALAKMSVFYNSPELTAEQNIDLINLLDSLAGETIYSRRHLLDTPCPVGPGETIDAIAKRYEVPTELLAKINGVDTTIGLLPGTKLKVFRGPFRAEVDVNRHEMTVFLGDLYAGRFPVSTGSDPQPKEGVFQVLDKQRHRNYYGKGGIQIDGNDPRNPYGGWWMDLGQELSIHGSPDNPSSDNSNLGCISLSPLDAGDVFSMLSRGSQVTIKR